MLRIAPQITDYTDQELQEWNKELHTYFARNSLEKIENKFSNATGTNLELLSKTLLPWVVIVILLPNFKDKVINILSTVTLSRIMLDPSFPHEKYKKNKGFQSYLTSIVEKFIVDLIKNDIAICHTLLTQLHYAKIDASMLLNFLNRLSKSYLKTPLPKTSSVFENIKAAVAKSIKLESHKKNDKVNEKQIKLNAELMLIKRTHKDWMNNLTLLMAMIALSLGAYCIRSTSLELEIVSNIIIPIFVGMSFIAAHKAGINKKNLIEKNNIRLDAVIKNCVLITLPRNIKNYSPLFINIEIDRQSKITQTQLSTATIISGFHYKDNVNQDAATPNLETTKIARLALPISTELKLISQNNSTYIPVNAGRAMAHVDLSQIENLSSDLNNTEVPIRFINKIINTNSIDLLSATEREATDSPYYGLNAKVRLKGTPHRLAFISRKATEEEIKLGITQEIYSPRKYVAHGHKGYK